MPSKTKAQHNFMEAIAHSAAFAKKVGVAQSVGQDFAKADKLSGKFMKKKKPAKIDKLQSRYGK